ncbi:glycosyltransferase family 87 protein [Nioella nitratireducens]|uniref:glycosyltransferase family 87 protein n=1 Tax=Nioella nitratireducens TaxID=1287720 RepID=UPI0008FD31D2|nr:glycosyltransferase family 87 protein [Nioella nitratireducens]
MPLSPAPPSPDPSGEGRLRPLTGRAATRFALIGAGLTVLITALYIALTWRLSTASGATVFNVDFRVFWAAARLAIDGHPLDAFDVNRLAEVQDFPADDWMPWVYPPGFLLMILPLGLVSFFMAWTVYTGASIAAMLAALRPFTRTVPALWIGFALAPTALVTLMLGQISLFWGAGLVAALAALRSDRPFLAGVFLGLLTAKPQLGLLIPVALIAAGHWRTIGGAALTTLLLMGGATALFGLDYWPAWRDLAGIHLEVLRSDVAGSPRMISVYSFLARLGLAEPVAFATQGMATVLAGVGVWLGWRRPGLSFDLRAAMLLTAIPLCTPYLWYNETALFAPALLFLLRSGALPMTTPGLIFAFFYWIGIGPITVATVAGLGPLPPPRLVAVPLMLVAFALALRPVLMARSPRPKRC